MLKRYYIPSKNGKPEEVSKDEYLAFVGQPDCRDYIIKLYKGLIALGEVPEDKRDQVQQVVNNRISRYGNYNAQPATKGDFEKLFSVLIKSNMTRGEVNQLISDFSSIREDATDATASRTVSMFPQLKHDNSLIKAGTRINWAGVIKRAAVDLWDTIENNPDDAPQLWEDLNYQNGYRVIPETITVGLAFAKDEIGVYKNKLYKSLMDANVYTPEQYPVGWEEVIEEV